MRTFLIGLMVLVSTAPVRAGDMVYEGTWVTTNRPLDGPITCVVTDLGDNKWRGHFYGVWQGVEFSYKVDFSGPADKLRGKAMVDGANYEWTGVMNTEPGGSFKGKFQGDRYLGSFSMKKKGKG
jgi:hypothetical protein